jgi:hypothetical protein
MVWSLSRPSVRVRARPMLAHALDKLTPRLPGIHGAVLLEQLRRNKVFGFE